ncbi:prophage Lp1 protein 51 [Streptococcus infantarius subsp. infantarius]|nr:prophage Lp1 protein 51 [Streptococcus infantarius subsp. infantarius]MCO4575500.1 prophage Lp1 protein 51 [Streptococcus infantarius subsp. infantarius]
MGLEINEYIQFMSFNSKNEKLYLIERKAPTPEEKEILKDIPFKQGVLDFSALLGSRVFKNRDIEYVFMLFNTPYNQRKIVERNIKQKLMVHPRNKLYDTHDANYYWLGKCKSVEVENGERFNQLKVTITFDCYPYMISHKDYFDDYWDTFSFDDDVANYTKYLVNGSLNFQLVNAGSVSVKPKITVNSTFRVKVNDEDFIEFQSGSKQDYYLSLRPGINDVRVEGTGTIQFHYQKEVMG